MSYTYPKLHNAGWPGVVGKGDDEGQEPIIGLEKMLDLTAAADVGGVKFDGVDLFLFAPHVDIDSTDDALKVLAEKVQSRGLVVGSVVAPVWPETGGGSAMDPGKGRTNFLTQVKKGSHIAQRLRELGVRPYGIVRIDSAGKPQDWAADPAGNTAIIAETFRHAAKIAADHGERLAAEGEICWAGMHSWKDMLDLLRAVDKPEVLGFQADMAHTYLYLMGHNAQEHALLQEGYSEDEFYAAYATMTDKLRPRTIDFHIAQNDGSVNGAGSHDKTGRHCEADDPNGKLDITKAAGYWLKNAKDRGIKHICWDGCMFPNTVMEKPETWNNILAAMIKVRDAHGWN